ncbi:hypothetical protein P7C70_g8074, partial [Phenoliferia sp. Uapishka_3]
MKTLLPSDPTHFGVILAGTGLTESILAAALSKAGYSVLHLDQSPIYGDEFASLTLKELLALPDATTTTCSTDKDATDRALAKNAHFSLTLSPSLLPALGPGISVLRRSRVAVYLQFGILGGIGFWSAGAEGNAKGKGAQEDVAERGEERSGEHPSLGHLVKVPMTKADIFNSSTLSLVQKRRVTKLLLFALEVSDESFGLEDPTTTFRAFLKAKFAIDADVAETVAYALCLCTNIDDLALPTLTRLRTTLRSAGVYGPSPFLVGHYGGVGDLIGGFSRSALLQYSAGTLSDSRVSLRRICAVWGGGQILGRKMGALVPNSPVGIKAEPANAGGPTAQSSSLTPAAATPSTSSACTALGIPVFLDEGAPPDIFTADWIISSQSHLSTLCPPSNSNDNIRGPHTVQGIVIMSASIPFDVGGEEEDRTDSTLFVFPPTALCPDVGSVTVMQVGNSTFSCPEGYCTSFIFELKLGGFGLMISPEPDVLYLSAPLLSATSSPDPSSILSPYLTALLSLLNPLDPSPVLFTSYRTLYSIPSSSPPTLPTNFRAVPSLPSRGGARGALSTTAQLVSAVDEAAVLAEELFWEIVGEEGRKEGVIFFPEEEVQADEEV